MSLRKKIKGLRSALSQLASVLEDEELGNGIKKSIEAVEARADAIVSKLET